jgi:hypothetical protein
MRDATQSTFEILEAFTMTRAILRRSGGRTASSASPHEPSSQAVSGQLPDSQTDPIGPAGMVYAGPQGVPIVPSPVSGVSFTSCTSALMFPFADRADGSFARTAVCTAATCAAVAAV